MNLKNLLLLFGLAISSMQAMDDQSNVPSINLSKESIDAISGALQTSLSDGIKEGAVNAYRAIKDAEEMGTDEDLETQKERFRQKYEYQKELKEYENSLKNEDEKDDLQKDLDHQTELELAKIEAEKRIRTARASMHDEIEIDSRIKILNYKADDIKEAARKAADLVLNWQNIVQYGGLMSAAIGIPSVGYYCFKSVGRMIEEYMLNKKPSALTEDAKIGAWDRYKRRRSGYKMPELILHADLKKTLTDIVQETILIKQRIKKGANLTYSNILFWGPPGTGKTMFIKALADFTDMDFAPTTAAKLLGAGTAAIDELIQQANKSKYGMIIFIDEADALFIDRNQLNPDSDLYRVLNHLLALTGSGSKKFMIVAATNHRHVLDEAMDRRFQKIVYMPLPDESTRKAIINLYIKNIIYDIKTNTPAFIAAAKKLLHEAVINAIAKNTEGLSNAELSDMIKDMNKRGLTTKKEIMTGAEIQAAVDAAVDKRKKAEEAAAKREEHFARLSGKKASHQSIATSSPMAETAA